MVCWGSNMRLEEGKIAYKLGPNAVDPSGKPLECSAKPVPVDLGVEVIDIGMGFESTYAVDANSVAYGWGYNDRRQLGIGRSGEFVEKPERLQFIPRDQPDPVPFTNVRDVLRTDGRDQCAELHSPRETSRFYCWGRDGYGELGQGKVLENTTLLLPTETVLPPSARNLVRGENHGCFLVGADSKHEVWCFGAGQLVANGAARPEISSEAIPPQPEPQPVVWKPENFEAGLYDPALRE